MPPLLALLAPALAAGPVTVPCALDALPDGELRWDPSGRVELVAPDGAVVSRIDTEMPSAGPPRVTCKGTRVSIVLPPDAAHPTFALDQARMDFAEPLASWVRFDPVEVACAAARAALDTGRLADAAGALAKVAPADPRVARIWLAIGHAAATAVAPDPAAALALREVAVAALAAPGFTADEADAFRVARAEALVAAGRADDALVAWREILARDPRSGVAALAIADLLWDRGDKADAREAYLAALPLLAAVPDRVSERCPACKRAMRDARR